MRLLKLISELSLGKLAILGVVTTALYFLMYYDSGASLNEKIKTAESTLAQESAKKTETNRILKEENEMKANIVELARKLEVVKSRIPSDFKDNDVILLINQTAQQSGLVIETLAKASEVTSSASTDASFAEASKMISEIPFNISINGSYNRFLAFIEYLAKSERMVRFKNLTIDKTNLTNFSSNRITIKGLVVGYRQSTSTSNQLTDPKNGVGK